SLRYQYVGMSEPIPGVPQYIEMGFLDGIPITRYDSERGQTEPTTPWMAAGAQLEFWDRVTQNNKGTQQVYAVNFQTL
ncbi:HMR1 protein, partial [Pitta sordida]|nr:HMR1 protein [Pitta sordida]